MQKMGFQEVRIQRFELIRQGRGLGPEGKGRVEPIQAQLRGKQTGIGFGSKEQPDAKSDSERLGPAKQLIF